MSLPSWAVRRARTILRYEGPRILLWRIARKVLAPIAVVGASRIYQQSLAGPLAVLVPDGISVGPLEPADLESVIGLMVGRDARGRSLTRTRIEGHRRTVEERLAAGQECFVARHGHEVVHCSWVTFNWIEWPGEHWTQRPAKMHRLVVLGGDEAFHSDAYTREAWRGRGLYAVVLSRMLQDLSLRGIRRVYAEIAVDNPSSSKTHERLGWHRLGTVFYLRLVGSSRVVRYAVDGQDPFVPQPEGSLRFRAVDEPSGSRSPRIIVVVRRDQRELYARMCERYGGVAFVTLDRRQGERRYRRVPVARDHRRGERRRSWTTADLVGWRQLGYRSFTGTHGLR